MTIFSAHAKAALSDIVANHRFISQSPGQLEREKIVNWIFFATVTSTKAYHQKTNVGKSCHHGDGGCWPILVSKGKDNRDCEAVSWKRGLTRLD